MFLLPTAMCTIQTRLKLNLKRLVKLGEKSEGNSFNTNELSPSFASSKTRQRPASIIHVIELSSFFFLFFFL